jgi:hypothetical protein
MRVLLQNTKTRLYYAPFNQRLTESALALDFVSIPDAAKFAFEEDLGDMEIVLSYDDPQCEVHLPVLPEWCLLDPRHLLPV